MSMYRVAYEAHVEADTPYEAAEKLAEILARPMVPARGLYEVEGPSGEVDWIDLGEEEW